MLAVQQLCYFLREHQEVAGSMLRKQAEATASREAIAATGVSKAYPFAAAGINVTRVVAQAFGLVGAAGNKTEFRQTTKNYWTLVDEFSELYCVV